MKPRYDPRIFLALELSRTAQERMGQAQADLKQYLSNWHFIPPVNFHVTLRFFGEVPEAKITEIDAACREIIPRLHALSLHWNAVDFFGSPDRARVLFIGADGCPELGELVGAILQTFPGPDQRKHFRAHVTLAKARKHMEPGLARMNANMLRRLRELGRIGPEPIEVDVTTVHREIVMMETIWVGRAVEYEVRKRYPLMMESH
ncbi:RNA 2',3'-cyclic phosphodiesterase [bacterium]|nr:RNA 2',3'-cyclic phosphodiesterase [bacterium]